MRPSSPEMPTALPPWRAMRLTISLFTLPTSTILATSMVASSVTRRPSTNFGSMPSRAMCLLISGPPPCTTTGFMPTRRSSTMSSANCSRRRGLVMAAPPYLITTVVPQKRRMYGMASSSVWTVF